MTKPVVNIAEAKAMPFGPEGGSDTFGAMIAPIGEAIGCERLGAMFVTVEPGKRAFPFHNHLGCEEMFVILEGTGTYRFGKDEYPVRAGDVCSAPRGGPDRAHQIINTGTTALKYLGISDFADPEIVEYPDSGKFSAIAVHPGESFWQAHLRYVGRTDGALDYWDGEDT